MNANDHKTLTQVLVNHNIPNDFCNKNYDNVRFFHICF